MKKQSFLYLVLGAALASSCVKDKYDFNNAQLNYTPKFALPLLNASIITEDLLKDADTTLITTGADNVLKVLFTDTLMSIGMSEFVDIQDVTMSDNLKIGAISIEDKAEKNQITCGTILPTYPFYGSAIPISFSQSNLALTKQDLAPISDFTTLTFSEGTLELKIENSFKCDLSNVKVKLFSNFTDLIADVTFPSIAMGTTQTQSIDLSGKTITNQISYEMYNFDVAVNAGAVMQMADSLNMNFLFKGAKVVSGTAIFPSSEAVNDTVAITLASPNGEQLKQVIMNNANMNFKLNYGVAENSKMKITLPYATKGGIPYEAEFVIPANSTNFTPVLPSLAGYTVDLTAGGTTVNAFQAIIVDSIVSSGVAVPFDTSNAITYDISISGIAVDYVKGYFGNQVVNFDEQELETGFGSDPLLEAIKFNNPKINLSFKNSFNLPFVINKGDAQNLVLKMTGGTSDVTLSGVKESNILAGDVTTPITSVLVIDTNGTNLDDAFNSRPTKVVSSGSAEINPGGNSSTINEAWSNSELLVVSQIEVPMSGTINNLTVRDTSEMDLGELFENVKSVTLRANITNEFPLDGKVQIIFTDVNYVILDSISDTAGGLTFMSAASTDDEGVSVTASTKQTDFVIDETKAEKLKNTKYAIIVAVINSPKDANNNSKVMKILSTYDMNIKLGVIAKLSIKKSLKKEE